MTTARRRYVYRIEGDERDMEVKEECWGGSDTGPRTAPYCTMGRINLEDAYQLLQDDMFYPFRGTALDMQYELASMVLPFEVEA